MPSSSAAAPSAADLRAHWRPLVVVGLLNTAVPFWLLSWGETRIDSGLASIIQASVPIFNAVLAFGFFHDERVTGRRLARRRVGFVGVAVLVGAQPHAKLLGALAVVGMALCYAAGGLLTRRHLASARPHAIALGTSLVAAIAVTPAGVAQAPQRRARLEDVRVDRRARDRLHRGRLPHLLHDHRAAPARRYAALVTYLVPPVALGYGAIFLDEGVGAAALVGLVLILAGVTLGTRRAARSPRPAAAAEAPA